MGPRSDSYLNSQSSRGDWMTSHYVEDLNKNNTILATTKWKDSKGGPGTGFYIGWVLVVMFFLALMLWKCLRRHRRLVEQEERESSRRTQQQHKSEREQVTTNERKSMLLKYFESNSHQMVLCSENFTFVKKHDDVDAAGLDDDTVTATGKEDTMEQGMAPDVYSDRPRVELTLLSSLGRTSAKGTNDNGGAGGEDKESQLVHLASNDSGCAICLEIFKVQDTVVWSSDVSECPHVFHRSCVVDYWSTVNPKLIGELNHTPCPCCRRQFCLDFRFDTKGDPNEQSRQARHPETTPTTSLQASLTDSDSDSELMSSSQDEVGSISAVRVTSDTEIPAEITPTLSETDGSRAREEV